MARFIPPKLRTAPLARPLLLALAGMLAGTHARAAEIVGDSRPSPPAPALTTALRPDRPIPPAPITDLEALSQSSLDGFEHAYDAYLAERVLSSIGRLAVGQPLKHVARVAPDPFRARPPAASGGFDWNALGSQRLGAAQGLAVGINHRFADASTFSTDISLHHAAGPIDVSVDIKGDRSLVTADPVSLSYRSTAMLAVNPDLQVGVAAHGDLGTVSALAPTGTQAAGPVVRLNLLGDRATLSTSANYDFTPDTQGPPPPGRLHVDLGLNVKL